MNVILSKLLYCYIKVTEASSVSHIKVVISKQFGQLLSLLVLAELLDYYIWRINSLSSKCNCCRNTEQRFCDAELSCIVYFAVLRYSHSGFTTKSARFSTRSRRHMMTLNKQSATVTKMKVCRRQHNWLQDANNHQVQRLPPQTRSLSMRCSIHSCLCSSQPIKLYFWYHVTIIVMFCCVISGCCDGCCW